MEKEVEKDIQFSDAELIKMAYALECRFGFGDDLSEKIYDYLEQKTGKNHRI